MPQNDEEVTESPVFLPLTDPVSRQQVDLPIRHVGLFVVFYMIKGPFWNPNMLYL